MSNSTLLSVRYPAEWESQATTWLSWPHNPLTWAEPRGEQSRQFYRDLISLLLRYQAVDLLIPPDLDRTQLAGLPQGPHSLRLHATSTNDIWIRDYGPLFLQNTQSGAPLLLEYGFNAWGGKFPPWDADNAVPTHLAQLLGMELISQPFIMEGGALEFNGQGAAITTLDCLVGPGRQQPEQEKALADNLCQSLGLQDLLILPGGLHGDHTDGHIDNVARFVAPHTVVLCRAEPGPNQHNLEIALHKLRQWQPGGYPLDIHLLPLPPQRQLGDEVLPASYANFIYANGAIIVPTYDCAQDAEALALLGHLHPDREIVGMDCRVVIEEGGSLHCLSKQQPAL